MHIPENYLSPSTCGVFGIAMVPILGVAISHARKDMTRSKMALLGVAAAFSFLAMMFNIPLPGGTTGHAVCGTLIAILFGPWEAVIAISMVLFIQAMFFGDGGMLALGANCFNMAFVLPMIGYSIYKVTSKRAKSLSGELAAAGIASYVALNAAALCAAIEFGIQPSLFTDSAGNALYCPYNLSVSIPAMMLGHLSVAGAAEAIFTVAILAFVRKVAPSFAFAPSTSEATNAASSKGVGAIAALIGVLVVATPLGLLATGDAWGEWDTDNLASMIGYTPLGMENGWEWEAFFPDYSFGALPEAVGYILSAVIGIGLLILIFRLISFAVKKDTPDF